MLSELYIKDFALIDEIRIVFNSGLNIITGETGSGKSIMIDALSLALGKKGSKSLVRKGKKKAIVEALFQCKNREVDLYLERLGIDRLDENQIIITREITADGRSTSRINGRVINQSDLKLITSNLITIHGQNEYEQILQASSQLKLLDCFAGEAIEKELKTYQSHYLDFREIKKDILRLNDNMDEASLQRELDLLDYEINEIQEADIGRNERDELKDRLNQAENIEKISGNLEFAYSAIYEEESSVLNQLSKSIKKVEDILEFDQSFDQYLLTLNESYYSLEDLARDLAGQITKFDNRDDNLEDLNVRLDKINQIYRKYGQDFDAVEAYKEASIQRKKEIVSRDEIKEELQKKLDRIQGRMETEAKALSSTRKTTSELLLGKIKRELEDLNMANARLKVDFIKTDFNQNGQDQVDFLVSFNRSEEPKAFAKVASGGEISRFMLALKTVIASTDEIGSLIFDEIDTGVSGISAQKIGIKLKEISKHRQVICITHLPQIASYANSHFMVEKEQNENETYTRIIELDEQKKINEIAKMMSGLDVTESSLQTARDLLMKNSESI